MRPSIGALFSIYSKDHPTYLFEALWSLLRGQTLPVDACVGVIEGEIGAELEAIVSEFHEVEWIRIPRTQHLSGFGLPEALNTGLDALQTDIVLKVDTDDLNAETRVSETLKAFTEHPDLVLFGSQVQEWDPDFQRCFGRRRVPTDSSTIHTYAQRRNPFNGPSVAFKRESVLGLGGYPHVGANEDYALWAAILSKDLKVQNHPEDLVFMRGGPDLVARRSSRRYRKGEVDALKAIRATGLWSGKRFLLHYVAKQVVRRLPDSWNRYIYRKLRQTILAKAPKAYLNARDAWNTFQS